MRGSNVPVTGMCIVRVQVGGDGLRYRVVVNPDISTVRAERTREYGGLDATVRAVRAFLEDFAADLPCPPA